MQATRSALGPAVLVLAIGTSGLGAVYAWHSAMDRGLSRLEARAALDRRAAEDLRVEIERIRRLDERRAEMDARMAAIDRRMEVFLAQEIVKKPIGVPSGPFAWRILGMP